MGNLLNETDTYNLKELGVSVSDHVNAMLAYWDKNQVCRFANNAYYRWFGKTKEEMIGKITLRELLGESLYIKNEPYIREVLNGKSQEFEREIPIPGGGGVRHSIANYFPDIKNGSVKGFFVHVADVTNIKNLESELKNSETKFKVFINNAPDAILIFNKDRIIQVVNNECERMFGYSRGELLDHPVNIFIPDQYDYDTIINSIRLSQTGNKPKIRRIELQAKKKSGEMFPVDITLCPLITADGLLISAIIRDITWKVEKEKELKNSLDIITTQNKQLLNFAYIVSHNLKSYSSNLAAMIELLEGSNSDKEKLDRIGFIKKISTGFTETVKHLNYIVEVQNLGDSNLVLVNLKGYLNKCLDILNSQINVANAIVDVKVPEQIEFLYNPAYLESVLLNLLSNAIKYRESCRECFIAISLKVEDDYYILQITDNGKGINLEKYGNKLFGLYKTFHGNPDAKGIGLFITKYQIEAMGGHVEVLSKDGEGTTFYVYFKRKK